MNFFGMHRFLEFFESSSGEWAKEAAADICVFSGGAFSGRALNLRDPPP
ncbi:hypothetical protein CCP2SC5_940005 [Azospirillaceae bacterium]